jgi:ABC-type Fe3+-hydroxamate transport system substrate-binding protein
MSCRNIAIIAVTLLVFSGFLMIPASDTEAASEPFTVTDGLGKEFTFNEPVNKVVTLGKGPTSLALNLGCLNKIVVCDTYSSTATESLFDGLKSNVAAGKIAAGGSIYASGQEQLKKEVIAAADPETGSFNKETDAILMFGSPTYVDKLVDYFKEMGFKNILVWDTATEYQDIVDCTQAISKLLIGETGKGVETINKTLKTINETLIKEQKWGTGKGFYITFSANNWKVGNAGSLASSMIGVAGGTSVTEDKGQTGSTYAANPAQIIEKYGKDTIIFVDNVVAKNADKMSELRTMVGNDVKLVALENLWNNYSFESINGVWTMASAMYPDLFSGDVPYADDGSSNFTTYLIIGVIVTILIIGVAVLYGKKI